MPARYPKAVGKQPPQGQLGWSFFDWFSDYKQPAPLRRAPYVDQFWNAGVNMAYGREAAYQNTRPVAPLRSIASPGWPQAVRSGGDTGLKPKGYRKAARSFSLWGVPSVDIGVEAYNRAQAEMSYGNTGAAKAELGDLFNDIMGAVIPGWDQRPQALKDIRIKPDPNKIISAAQQTFPNAGADIVKAANAAGMNIYVNTPMGEVLVTPQNAQLYYGNYQFITKAQGMLGSLTNLSPMTWLAVGGIGLGLFLMMKR